ncbi:serum response factor homolog isoform X1 [Diorhabda carinulata]|uniref:serum response factor homolog isoform X1 n=1 Tax=Diorhabda carinulata TaxID=1163345 RepID=UPI0025A262F9|nr:serum response factor homolog isoform X1 [Diorhabda carinulata]
MEPGGRDSRFNLGYSMNLLSGETPPEIYGNPNLGRPSTSLQQLSPRHTMVSSACNRGIKSDMYDDRAMSSQGMGLDGCVNEINEDSYSMQSKKSPPSNGKKTKGRVKIKMEYIENKLRRYTTFSKRKTGIMKKAYELSTLTGTQVMLLVASETGHVYTFATRKLQPMITSEAGKALIQTCLNSPDPPAGSAGGDQRMSATGFEETELTYNISDDDSKDGDTASDSDSDDMEMSEDCIDNRESSISMNQSQETEGDRAINKKEKYVTNNVNPKEKPENNGNESSTISQSTTTTKDQRKEITFSHGTVNNIPTSRFEGIYVASSTASTSIPVTEAACALPTNTTSSFVSSTNTPLLSVGTNPTVLTSVGANSNRLQALPLVLQTPAGMGYASTPDGMILGLLQGPNITQPQFVAIPMSGMNMDNLTNAKVKTNCDSS